ncbi:piggyBac transposable element-derived protein 3-like [Onthophagus taurus]|uniref:piggyBac transposable element-derived protein 3-like n=1 Tax=Onthophagus taurus TaxID=166361 RepID=UPI0039BE53A9
MVEDNDDIVSQVDEITIFPPVNAAADLTDEDSGAENDLTVNNLPASQLQAPVEIVIESNYDSYFSSDDNIPLSELQSQNTAASNKQKVKTKKRQMHYSWIKEDLKLPPTDFDSPTNSGITENPLELFSKFFDEEVIELILNQSNKYAQQKNRKANIAKQEVNAFIGVLILSGYMQVPRRKMFWEREKDCHNVIITEAITRDRFEYLFSNLHVCDNQQLDQGDKFAKLRPLSTLLNKKFMDNSSLEEMHSVDEAMVPYYGCHSCKQYIRGKPVRYGYKLWVGSTRLGYWNWFEPYQGASTNISENFSELGVGAGVVLEYAQALRKEWPDKKCHLFFDNFFTSIPLIEKLTDWNFYATGTVGENRLKDISLIDSKLIKKQRRGSYDYAKIVEQNIIAVKWHDNSVVSVCSNFSGVAPIHSVTRYSQKEKKNIQVQQPHLIQMYNTNMECRPL